MDHLACFTPGDLASASAPDLSNFRWRLLAQGDSWFSTAAAKLNAHANLLQEMVFKQPVCAINCAGSGEALSHMVDLESAPDFVRLLSSDDAPTWDGVLLSVGGNDLIAAAQTPAHTADGQDVPLHLRLLRRQTEWGPPSAGVARYFSEPGWATYSDYLRTNVRHLLTLRDQGPSAGKPVFMHCYAVPMPRPAGAEDAGLGASGPWLYPALKACALPAADWAAVSRLMVFHLALLLKSMAADKEQFPGLHVFDSTAVPLAPATPGSSGSSGDWHNEIHLNHSGCFKIARAWSENIEDVLNGVKHVEPSNGRRKG
ncbi:hypothetical protein [Paucibacter sp. Y2R2-4]|uniref:hypothetical protein n=1 Tax=Paucibacter sp. Y2R2-4 TaxID=2893553 RepID=UPI0021E50917|nr:hypothetical protein [Paucibacter sp. Y2R2-4]MCV2350705.1 hypothetical protein [Paucibacter sp. Y2R2-4]